ncbi:hypothetical protein QBC42DRAFT_69641 [Cladorrhinum samala]|uniref:Uncharacterized protein n=1 Tax=Cladorrhinum samala TaxID=585594 RepID=A0AAV9HU33_9PEZI|nr:hypothetical protein QBC42DRAFT_69641 [Cladorrhinum samala]
MGSIDFDQVLFTRASWRKLVLVPAWLFQILVLLCLMGIFAYRLAETFEHYDDEIEKGQIPMVEIIWEATNVGFNLISLVLTLLEIARYATERLTPFLMLSTHIIKLTLSLAVLGLDVVAHLRSMDGFYATIGLSLDCGLLAVILGILLYAIITYRRLLKYEAYRITPHPNSNQAQPALGQGHKPGFSVSSHELSPRPYNPQHDYNYPRTVESEHRRVSGIQQSPYSDAVDTSYHSQTAGFPSHSRSHSRINSGESRQSHFTEQMSPVGGSPPAGNQLQAEVNRALDAELGWGENAHRHGSSPDRNASVVKGAGSVQVNRSSLVTLDGVHRQHSWRTEKRISSVGLLK